jgi:hypothetical protein
MPEQEGPEVVLRGPADGDSIILPMGGLRAHLTRKGSYTFYTDAAPAEGIGPGTFVFIPPGAVHGFRTGPEGGRLLCIWPSTVETAFFSGYPPSPADQ